MNSAKYKQLINIAKQQLAMDENAYRSNLLLWVGKESLKTMTHAELTKVYKGMKDLGFKPHSQFDKKQNGKKKGISPEFFKRHPEAKKLGFIWSVMHSQKFVKKGSYTALEAWAIPQSKPYNDGKEITKLEWMGDILYGLIEQLKQFHKRKMIENGWIIDQIHNTQQQLEHVNWSEVSTDDKDLAEHHHHPCINRVLATCHALDDISHDRLVDCWNAIIFLNGLATKHSVKGDHNA